MPTQFLADPNEDEAAADFYMERFSNEGFVPGKPISLVVQVSGIKPDRLDLVEAQVRALYDPRSVERREAGLSGKKFQITAYLKPIPLSREQLLAAARSLYRIILDHGVAVELLSRGANENRTIEGAPWNAKGWRWWLVISCFAYMVIFWVLPIVLVLLLGELPYLHHHAFAQRFVASVCASILVLAILYLLSPSRRRPFSFAKGWQKAKLWFGAVAGFLMFSACAASLGGSVIAVLVKAGPAVDFSAQYEVLEARHTRTRDRVQFTLSQAGRSDAYLVTSAGVFAPSPFRNLQVGEGDRIELRGRQNVFGIYIDSVYVVSPAADGPNRTK